MEMVRKMLSFMYEIGSLLQDFFFFPQIVSFSPVLEINFGAFIGG